MIALERAYDDCYQIIKHHSKTFAKAFGMLPVQKKNAVWAVYAFCREVDDIVDERDNPKEELAYFEQSFHELLNGRPLASSKWVALSDVFNRYNMDEMAFFDMIQGQKMDLLKNRYDTMEELEEYCYHVASTVGLMLLPILAPEKYEELRPGGVALGLAMQITNILRDIGEDLARNRIYLPLSLLKQYGLTTNDLKEQKVTPAFIQVWEHMAKRAEQLFLIALESIEHYPLDSRMPVKGAAYMYRAILDKIRHNNYQVFQEKNFVSKEEKTIILTKINAETSNLYMHKV